MQLIITFDWTVFLVSLTLALSFTTGTSQEENSRAIITRHSALSVWNVFRYSSNDSGIIKLCLEKRHHRFLKWWNVLFKTAVCYLQAPFYINNRGPPLAVEHKTACLRLWQTHSRLLFSWFSEAMKKKTSNHTAILIPMTFPHLRCLFMQWMCTYLSSCGGSDGRLFACNHSFHCLYHPSTATQQQEKMDSPPVASGSLTLCFLQLLPLT